MSLCSEKGFTLFELILALVLTGLLVAMVGTGVVSGFNLFAAARDNTHITQKANLALTRLTRELREITDVHGVDANRPYLIYDRGAVRNAIALDANVVKLYSNVGAITSMDATYIANNGDILIDNVTALSLGYFNGANTWQPTDPIRELSAIEFQFTVGRDTLGGRNATFGNTVHLRNNNNYGGAALTVTPPTPPTLNTYPCFIGTAGKLNGTPPWPLLPALSILSLILLVRLGPRRPISPPEASRRLDSRGAALIAIIVVLVVFSTLAIIMLPMITTSQYTQLGQDAASKTYYLAESGYRYAASQYLNAGSDTAKNVALESLHGQPHTLAGGSGSFQVEVYPYYGYVYSDPAGTNTLTIRMPGGLTDDLNDSAFSGGGRLQIGRTIFSYSSADTSIPPNVSFTMTATMPSLPLNTNVYFLARTAGSQTVTQDGTINMTNGSTRTFPLQNAEVVIDGNVYAYRENDRSGNRLIGISDPEVPNMSAWTLPANTDVLLSRFVDLESTGSYGSGALASQRLLTYHVPLPNTEFARRRLTFHDAFDDLSHWTNIWGGQAVADIGGNAMAITGVRTDVPGFPRISLAALSWTTTELDLELVHQRADYFLSYDAQVKVGFRDLDPADPTDDPDWGFTPTGSEIPTYLAAGLSFRLDDADDSHNAYGLSLMRGNNAAPSPYDNLPNELLDPSFNDKLVILLWQQTNDGGHRTWLAYKQIGDVEIFLEDVESGINGWTPAPPWAISNLRSHGGANSWHFARDGINSGDLVSPVISACDYDYLWLSYHSWHAKAAGDTLSVWFRTRDGAVWSGWSEIDSIAPDSGGVWERRETGVSVTPGAPVQFRFRYATDTGDAASYEGWFIDDIRVGGDWPVQEATLALRIQEAPSLQFSGGGTYAIQPGDLIFQNAASAMVDAAPIVQSGGWAGGDAAGHLVLKNLSGTFGSGTFSVAGVGPVATFEGFRARDNFIRAYYGSLGGCGTPNTDPSDNEKLANPREPTELNWPPVDGEPYTSADDAFTLLAWDAFNTVSSFTHLTDTQLRSDESVLLTKDEPLSQTRPELGLHALGKGAQNTYFDDFGLTVTFDGPVDITAPLQE